MTQNERTPAAIVDDLEAFPDELARVVLDDRSDEELMRPAADGGWGVVEIIPHLRDWEEILFERIHMIVEQENPHLPGYDDSLWAIEHDYRGQDPRESLAEFAALRQRTVDYLRGLPPDAFMRTGEHGSYGTVTLAALCGRYCDHDRQHAAQAREALAG